MSSLTLLGRRGRRDHLRRSGRPPRPDLGPAGQRPHLFRLHRGLRPGLARSRCWPSSGSSSAWAWAANGRAARRSSPRPGRPSTGARPWASSRASGPSATRRPRSCSGVVLPLGGWRAVFFVGVLPALLVFWVQKKVDEPAIWRAQKAAADGRARPADPVRHPRPAAGHHRRRDADERLHPLRLVGLQHLDPRLSLPRPGPGRHRPRAPGSTSALVFFMQFGMWLGYLTFGYFSDASAGRGPISSILLAAAVFIFVYAQRPPSARPLLPRAVRGLLRDGLFHRASGR